MTLRVKTLLIVGLTLLALLALFAALLVVQTIILQSGFTTVENNFVTTNVNRAFEALTDDIAKVNTTVGDWAPWDDTYAFVEDGNEAYINNNLGEGTFTNLDINVMVFVDSANAVVYGQGIDLASGEFGDIAAGLEEELIRNDLLLSHSDTSSLISGFVLLPENPMLIASQPILTSNGEGPLNGSLVMGRYLDEAQIEDLEARTKFVITIERLDQENLPADFAAALHELTETENEAEAEEEIKSNIHITPLSDERIAGYTIMTDIYGDPGLILRVDMARDVFAQGQRTQDFFIYALVGVGVAFLVLTLVIIERLVLARLFRVSAGVEEIGASGDLARRLTMPGTDELSQLAQAINNMLQDLQESLAREKQLKAEVQRLRIEIDQVKKDKEVAEIVESDYFQNLQQKAKDLRAERPDEQSDGDE